MNRFVFSENHAQFHDSAPVQRHFVPAAYFHTYTEREKAYQEKWKSHKLVVEGEIKKRNKMVEEKMKFRSLQNFPSNNH